VYTVPGQSEIDVTVGTVLASSLVDRPTVSSEHVADEPLELFGI
jgi:hypothetical protein